MAYYNSNFNKFTRGVATANSLLHMGKAAYSALGYGAPKKAYIAQKAYKKAPSKAYKPRKSVVRQPSARRKYKQRSGSNFNSKVKDVVYDQMCARNTFMQNVAQQFQPSGSAPTTGAVLGNLLQLFKPADIYTIAGEIAANPRAMKFRIESGSVFSTLVNQDIANAKLTLYYCRARRDVPASETNINTIFSAGLADPASATSLPGATDINVTPFMSPRFCAYFKIYKTKVVILPGGGTIQLKVSSSRRKTINPTVDISTDLIAHRNLTKFIFLKVEGQPTNDSVTKTNLGQTTPRIDVVNKLQIEFTWIADISRNINLISASGFNTVTLADVTSEMGQVIQTDASA